MMVQSECRKLFPEQAKMLMFRPGEPEVLLNLFLWRNEMETKTLRELVEEYGANGCIRIDDGNGSAGPCWLTWDKDLDAKLGDTEMHVVAKSLRAYKDKDNHETIIQIAKFVVANYDTDIMHASDWIEDDDDPTATNPYRYRLIF
jgi:hypothetical protein